MEEKKIVTDVLVIGGAGAGLMAALEARANGADVVLASKLPAGRSGCTLYNAGWITRATPASEDELFRQMVYTGGYLNNQRLVEVLIKDVVQTVQRLQEYGVPMSEQEGSSPDMPGHYVLPRVPGKPRGHGMMNPMREKAEGMGVAILDNTPISALITADNAVVGATGFDLDARQFVSISAKSTVLATGGGAYAFERNNNPSGTTGDGFSLAYRAGAELVDMELVSFNLSRDMLEMLLSSKRKLPASFLDKGMAHYFMGGVKIDEGCNSSVEGLFAAGEVTGGIFGAARLGGSAMADIIVFGARAGCSAARRAKEMDTPELNTLQIDVEREKFENMVERNVVPALDIHTQLRSALWEYMGIAKTEETLKTGLEELSQIRKDVSNLRATNSDEIRAALEASHILDLGQIIATASLIRKETRGNYWRAEYPQPDNDNWIKNIVVYKAGEEIVTRIDPVVMTRLHAPTQPPIGQGCFNYFPKLDI